MTQSTHPLELEGKQKTMLDDGANAASASLLPAEVPSHKGRRRLYLLVLACTVPTTSPSATQRNTLTQRYHAQQHTKLLQSEVFLINTVKKKKKEEKMLSNCRIKNVECLREIGARVLTSHSRASSDTAKP